MVELELIDICVEVLMLSSYLALPRKVHLEQPFHIFAYLKNHPNSEMPFDPTGPEIYESQFGKHEWYRTVYDGMEEELPPKSPNRWAEELE